jgi:hypothetical protein
MRGYVTFWERLYSQSSTMAPMRHVIQATSRRHCQLPQNEVDTHIKMRQELGVRIFALRRQCHFSTTL